MDHAERTFLPVYTAGTPGGFTTDEVLLDTATRQRNESRSDLNLDHKICEEDALISIDKSHPGPLPFIAAALCVVLATFLAIVPFCLISLSQFSIVLSNTGSTLYTGTTTVLAGLVSAFVVSQIKSLLS